MKQVITAVALVIIFLNISLAATKNVDTPAPEVIKCEVEGSCEMTEIEKLPEPKKKNKNSDKK